MSTLLVLQIIVLMFVATLCVCTVIRATKTPYRERDK